MLLNNAVSAAVGLVPFVGDIVLATFKANSRNAAILEEFLRIRGEEYLKRENQRVENPEVVRPGAGREEAEHVPGKDVKEDGGWFRRKSKSLSKNKSVSSGSNGADSTRAESRFVENVNGDSGSGKK